MAQFARLARGSSIELVKLDRPFSNFDFVDRRFNGLATLRRVFSQARRSGIRSAIVETIPAASANDLQEEDQDIASRYARYAGSTTHRISFFRPSLISASDHASLSPPDFFGYAIVKSDNLPRGQIVRVYESVVRPARLENNHMRGLQHWTCRVGRRTFTVSGYLFAQQNGVTNVCAHAALRSAAARYHPNGDMQYREMNAIAGVDHRRRKLGGSYGGLRTSEMVAILEQAGAKVNFADFTRRVRQPQADIFHKSIYGSIESGFPVVVVFTTTKNERHAITLFGHTFNQDTWVPNADLTYFASQTKRPSISSDAWLSTYIGHDDNWGSNFCIPRRYLYTRRRCKRTNDGFCDAQSECVAYVLATLPAAVQVRAVEAERIGLKYLSKMLASLPSPDQLWARRLTLYRQQHQLISRLLLVKREDYIAHLRAIRDWNIRRGIARAQIKALAEALPDEYMWMIELSIPELFQANHRKVGEVLLRAERKPSPSLTFDSFVLARLPGFFVVYKSGARDGPAFRRVPNGIITHSALYGCEDADSPEPSSVRHPVSS